MAVPRMVSPFWKYRVVMASNSPAARRIPTTGHTLLGTHLELIKKKIIIYPKIRDNVY